MNHEATKPDMSNLVGRLIVMSTTTCMLKFRSMGVYSWSRDPLKQKTRNGRRKQLTGGGVESRVRGGAEQRVAECAAAETAERQSRRRDGERRRRRREQRERTGRRHVRSERTARRRCRCCSRRSRVLRITCSTAHQQRT